MATNKLWKVYRYWITLDGFDWSYIGCTSQSLNDRAGGLTGQRYIRKSPKFGFAIETYGWGNFQREILEDGLIESEAFEKEKFYIQKFDSVNHGFNISTGGKSGTTGTHPIFSEEHWKKIVESRERKAVLQYDKQGNLIAEYPSIRDAERQTGVSHSHISSCLTGHRKSAGGYHWEKVPSEDSTN